MTGPRLSIIPAGAVTDRSLEPRDLQVLCLLGRHLDRDGWCVRSQVKMAAEIDCGRSSVQRSLDRLAVAGWIEKRRRDGGSDGDQQSAAYAYRVRLDIDTAENDWREEENSPQEQAPEPDPASHDAAANRADLSTEVPTPGQGCPPIAGHGCPPIAGHITPLSKREDERDPRARDREARGLVDFETRWPSSAADDRQRTAYAWASLSDAERQTAVASIAAFLENQKRLGRKHVPAGWKYLEEKRWTLLDQPKAEPDSGARHLPRGSAEANAVAALYRLAGRDAFSGPMRASDGGLWYRGAVTPQLLAFAEPPQRPDWVEISRQQAAAYNEIIDAYVASAAKVYLREGSHAPWPWPPSKDGKVYAGSDPPASVMTEEDRRELEINGL